MIKTHITWEQVYHRLKEATKNLPKGTKYYGVPRAGQIVAGMTGNAVDDIESADVIIDDLIDSGTTFERYKKHNKPFITLIDKRIELGKQKKMIHMKQLKTMLKDYFNILVKM